MAETKGKFDFAIDRGGTFTDVFARLPDGRERVLKLLSRDPQNYKDAPTEGIRRVLEEVRPVDTSSIGWIRMGTTVATNALLEREGERTALLVTKGFKDLLHIGTQARPKLFDLEVAMPDVLYEEVIEVDERVVLNTGDSLEVWQELDLECVEKDLRGVLSRGITSLAVLLLHSYTWCDHEKAVGALARSLGFTQVSLSSEVMPMVRVVPRGYTVCADAYLTPKIRQYLKGFTSGFEGGLKEVDVLFMQSDGGLTPMDQFCGSRAILSGPAGGVVGYAITSYSQMEKMPVIGFDMGGTSTDVSRYAGQYEHVFEATTAGVTLQAPQLDINTVAAGGGSRLFFRSGMFVVGPESAGAHPGPACYRKGGPLTVTDANLALGRLLPSFFPKIFGPGENEPLSSEETMKHFRHLTQEINLSLISNQSQMSVEDVAMGFIHVANEAMCRPIRALTQAKGHDTSQHALACFGGAGGQHACAIARALGMKTVFIHNDIRIHVQHVWYSGVLSAYGLALADVVEEVQEPCSLQYEQRCFDELDRRVEQLSKRCHDTLGARGFDRSVTTEVFLHLRYKGTDCALMVTAAGSPSDAQSCRAGDFRSAFTKRYLKEFGFTIPDRAIMVDDIRVRGCGISGIKSVYKTKMGSGHAKPVTTTKCYFDDGYLDTSVYLWEELPCGHNIQGPAIIIDKNSTILVEPCCEARLTEGGDVCITVGSDPHCALGTELNTVQLSIFSHRFMSIADGQSSPKDLHLHQHQGTPRLLLCRVRTRRRPRVQRTSHTCSPGRHARDCPAPGRGSCSGVCFMGQPPSRPHSHHTRQSVFLSEPPSVLCSQQRAPCRHRWHDSRVHAPTLHLPSAGGRCVFFSFKLVTGGVFQEEAVTEALMAPAQYPDCSGTRNLHDNLSDLRAQVAANQRGSQLVGELIDSYGLAVVQAYMGYIQSNAELAVRDMLRDFARRRRQQTGSLEVESEDFMDDGTPIRLRVQINEEEGSAVFDFTRTGTEVWGNCNAPRAITLSALIYCLRCMVGQDIPLNQGCLAPIKVIIPPGSILQPSQDAAVVGGNVLTSQRVVDVIFRAFEVCAASQGCMNNISFGSESTGYYETVAGGAGAGPGWNGRSGVHSHMTNTRITDPEILEKRYPVILEQFSLRPGSGGAGSHCGGDGVIRKLLFRNKVILSVLTERRSICPYGLQGGEDGAAGLNLLHRANGRVLNLGAKASISLHPGDMFCLYTPGGGGYGREEEANRRPRSKLRRLNETFLERGSVFEYRMAQEGV
uniref:5-oxoprolinase, ATP-hydrolysing n=1 Tax=Scophthalmus maximus TaxID=52904 RepID=A0A8D3BLT0_SCOMX